MVVLRPSGTSAVPFAPADVAGLTVDLDPRSLALADGDPVATWTDSSGHGNSVLGGTNKPTFKTSILNGLPVVRFTYPQALASAAFAGGTIAQPDTIFIVGKAGNAGALACFYDGIVATSNIRQHFRHTGGDVWQIQSTGTVLNGVASDASFHVFANIYNGATSKMYLAGGTPTTGDAGAGGLSGITLGFEYDLANDPLQGDIARVLIYTGALTTTQLDLVGNYLKTLYSLTWTAAI